MSDPRSGSGDGGPLGTPDFLPDEAPPSAEQEANSVVSGGGVVGPEEDERIADDDRRAREADSDSDS